MGYNNPANKSLKTIVKLKSETENLQIYQQTIISNMFFDPVSPSRSQNSLLVLKNQRF